MNNMHLYAALGAAPVVVAGCNRLHGVGHDIEKGDPVIDEAAK